ncbi:ABC transporter [Vandammella animalimorsus]|uniref:ABC transporter n=1 Tax=Vandammella animalimorsus TaxID=2029117 RepID=A0A2A2T6C2_9BURK|nr:ABC transporter ATP-binding protein [Vandammella animalimorsus]PAT32911.1 ABC transporter [Vandammella animalimorsus]PAX17323.1 ABC transporter [Vandammella animalimorsus]PAX19379.1 ABC transporter [Vandammella animalimorsus]
MNSSAAAQAQPGSSAIVLRASGIGKEYKLYDSPRQRLKALLTGRAYHRSHWALRDVSFELRRGQCIGIIGDNGAGKSSLLKLLAGTLQPSTGKIERLGRITAILELGAGFHPEFTGRDNLYFGGSMIGISHEQMRALEPEIIAFAGLGDALQRPVKTYSSGMVVRLAFALMTAVPPDVLIVDEALAVGDQVFQKKCVERIMAFKEQGCTILFCSHSPYHIRTLCDQAMWLDGGRIKEFGPTEPVLGAYEMHTRLRQQAEQEQAEPPPAPAPAAPADATDATPAMVGTTAPSAAPTPAAAPEPNAAHLLSVVMAHTDPNEEIPLLQSRDLVVTITARGQGDERPNIGFMLEQSKGVGITSLATHEEGAAPRQLADGSWQSVLTFPDLPLHSGQYVISAFLFDASGLVVYDEWLRFKHFRFVTPTLMPGLVKLPHHWS